MDSVPWEPPFEDALDPRPTCSLQREALVVKCSAGSSRQNGEHMLTDSLVGPLPRCSTDGCPNWVWTRSTGDGLGKHVPVSDKCYKCAGGVLVIKEPPKPAPAETP